MRWTWLTTSQIPAHIKAYNSIIVGSSQAS